MTVIRNLNRLGQSIWLDFIRRSLIDSGELEALIARGVTGVTSNPTILEKAIAGSADYDEALRELVDEGKTNDEIYLALALDDIRRAADLFRPVWDATEGADGYVSLEANPKLAHDTEGTIAEARTLFKVLGRPNAMIKGFLVFAKVLVALITLGLASIVLETLTGLKLIPGMDPIFPVDGDQPGIDLRAIEVIGRIAIVLLGAYPMVFLLTRWFEKPLLSIGKLLKMNSTAAAGMIATLANNIPMFKLMNGMDDRGKVLNVAFAVSAAFTFGDHLGFTAANKPDMIFAVIVGKLIGGITAVLFAMLLAPKGNQAALESAQPEEQ